jgi:hypothetical protein
MTISVLKVNATAFKGVRAEQYRVGPNVIGVVGNRADRSQLCGLVADEQERRVLRGEGMAGERIARTGALVMGAVPSRDRFG